MPASNAPAASMRPRDIYNQMNKDIIGQDYIIKRSPWRGEGAEVLCQRTCRVRGRVWTGTEVLVVAREPSITLASQPRP